MLAVLLLSFFIALIDVSIVNVALPSIQHGIGASSSDLQWILSGYALTFGVVLIAAGRAGDIVGRGGLFVLGLAIFTASSLAASLAPTPTALNVARFIEGVGSGFMSPQVYGMVQQYFHGPERGRAFGYLGMAASLSVATGPTLGGALIALGGPYWGWRSTFLVNVPLGIAGVILAVIWFPKPLVRFHHFYGTSRSGRRIGLARSLDLVGSALIGLAVFAVLLPFVEAASRPLLWLLVPAGLGIVLLWLWWERAYGRRGYPPMVDLHIFSIRSFTNGLSIQTLYFLGMTSIWVLVALYAQEAAGLSALETGLLGMPSAIISAFAANWAGKRVSSYGRPIVIGGQVVAIVGLLLSCAVIHAHAHGLITIWALVPALSVVGIGQGATISPNQTLTLEDIPLQYAGSSGAVMSTGQRIGTSIGIAMITAAAFATLRHASWSTAIILGFGLIVLTMLVAIAIGVRDLRGNRRG
ncbi:MAG TPA: MFS transporter [Nevskiaceae bacterium]